MLNQVVSPALTRPEPADRLCPIRNDPQRPDLTVRFRYGDRDRSAWTSGPTNRTLLMTDSFVCGSALCSPLTRSVTHELRIGVGRSIFTSQLAGTASGLY
jgi:hypothetical protein